MKGGEEEGESQHEGDLERRREEGREGAHLCCWI